MLVLLNGREGERDSSLPSADAGVVVLGDLLVGLLGSSAGGTLDGVRDVVGGVLNLVHFEGWFGLIDLVGC